MKTVQKNITKREFAEALVAALTTSKKSHKGTKLAYWCGRFLEANKEIHKSFNKERRKLTQSLLVELEDFKIDHCLERDGKLLVDEKGNYSFSAANTKAVRQKDLEIGEKIEALEEEYLNETIKVNVIISQLDSIPDNIDPDLENALNGFVYRNKNQFHEEIEVLETEE